ARQPSSSSPLRDRAALARARCDPKRADNGAEIGLHHTQQRFGGAARSALAALPFLQCSKSNAESGGELGLGEPRLLPDGANIVRPDLNLADPTGKAASRHVSANLLQTGDKPVEPLFPHVVLACALMAETTRSKAFV